MSCGKVRIFLRASRWSDIGLALIDFHPALQRRLDAHRRIHAFQVRILDALQHAGPDIVERLSLSNAAPRRVRLATETLDDLARFFEDRALFHVVEIPAGRARGL